MTDEELDALVRLAGYHREHVMTGDLVLRNPDGPAFADAITALRAQLAAANTRADRAEASLAAQIEVDAELCNVSCNDGGLAKSPAHFLTMAEHATYRNACRDYAAAIRTQPHDRTALDRVKAEARAQALREAAYAAANACLVEPDGGNPTEEERLVCDEACNRILALLDKEGA